MMSVTIAKNAIAAAAARCPRFRRYGDSLSNIGGVRLGGRYGRGAEEAAWRAPALVGGGSGLGGTGARGTPAPVAPGAATPSIAASAAASSPGV